VLVTELGASPFEYIFFILTKKIKKNRLLRLHK